MTSPRHPSTGIPLLAPEQHWECPNCDLKQVTHEPRPHTRMHPCRGLGGLTAPMVAAGTRCKVTVQHRDDYVGTELVQRDADGRPVASVVTVRDDGQDCTVFVPCATASARQLDINPEPFRARLARQRGIITRKVFA